MKGNKGHVTPEGGLTFSVCVVAMRFFPSLFIPEACSNYRHITFNT